MLTRLINNLETKIVVLKHQHISILKSPTYLLGMLRISNNYFKNDQITVAMNEIIDNLK